LIQLLVNKDSEVTWIIREQIHVFEWISQINESVTYSTVTCIAQHSWKNQLN